MFEIRKIINALKHAFAIDVAKLKEEDIVLIEKLADYVVRRKMSVPAILFLESVQPLSFIGSQITVFFEPILTNFFPTDEYKKLANILEKRDSLTILISEIEKRANGKTKNIAKTRN